MKKVTIYHNPRCSKSRQALQILLSHDFKPIIIEYLKTPLTEREITELLHLLGVPPREIMRKNEDLYKQLNLVNPDLTDEQLMTYLAENPILIERPIVVIDKQAILARPPEKILEII